MDINEAIQSQIALIRGEVHNLEVKPGAGGVRHVASEVFTLRSLLATLGEMNERKDQGEKVW